MTKKRIRVLTKNLDILILIVFMLKDFNATKNKAAESMFVNVGTGRDITIKETADLVKETVGYDGDIIWNTEMPDGTPQKLLDVSRLSELGWQAKTSLKEGISLSYRWYLKHLQHNSLG